MNFNGEETIYVTLDEKAGHGEQGMNWRLQSCYMVPSIRARSEEISTTQTNCNSIIILASSTNRTLKNKTKQENLYDAM